MDIHKSVRISLKAKLDKTNPKGVHIGAGTYIAFGSVILTHDMCRAIHKDVKIGENCFIGGNSIIMPGVTLGDSCIVAAGAVVTKDVSSGTIVAGNPAVVIRENIKTKALGILINE
jgi:acetyltransferase-like isoleucine patch superfamily enzyme